MTGHHIKLTGLLVTVINVHGIVKRQVVSGDAASDHGGMGREHGGDRELLVLKVQKSRTGLPLVELCDNLVGCAQIEVSETFYHSSRRVAEQEIFLVIPVAGDGIHLEALPVL